MGKFICKDCGYEGDKKNISVFSKIVFFIFILILITFLGVLMQVASQSP